MDKDLISASTYVNNLLQARGLLSGGRTISFANPTEDEETPARILNLVNNLLNRREKEAEQRENLALTIRNLRANEVKTNAANDRLRTKCDELDRKCAMLQGQERVLNATVRTAEATAKSLRDEAARTKTMLQQVRTQCANDMRKRDHQISRMKERLLDTTRGSRGSKQPMAFPGVSLSAPAALAASQNSLFVSANSNSYDGTASPTSQDYSLAQETTAFLTTLSQNLSDENDTLVGLIRSTVSTIKAISGMEDTAEETSEDTLMTANDISHTKLQVELEDVLDSLRELLNQPNYVPIEDLDQKDREVDRLKTQLKSLLIEWRKAIELVDLVNNRNTKLDSRHVKHLERAIEKGRKSVLEEVDVNINANANAHQYQQPSVKDEEEEEEEADETITKEEVDVLSEVQIINAQVADHLANLSRIEEESGLEHDYDDTHHEHSKISNRSRMVVQDEMMREVEAEAEATQLQQKSILVDENTMRQEDMTMQQSSIFEESLDEVAVVPSKLDDYMDAFSPIKSALSPYDSKKHQLKRPVAKPTSNAEKGRVTPPVLKARPTAITKSSTTKKKTAETQRRWK